MVANARVAASLHMEMRLNGAVAGEDSFEGAKAQRG
jgi:hypothetical protein